MRVSHHLAVPGALAAAWLLVAAIPPAALAGHPLERALAMLVVAAFAIALVVETFRALPSEHLGRVRRPQTLVPFSTLSLGVGLLLAWASGAVVFAPASAGAFSWSAGYAHGPLTVWPAVQMAWPWLGLGFRASLGWMLLGAALTLLSTWCLYSAWANARSRSSGAFGAACAIGFAAPACPSCLAPLLAAGALVGGPGLADALARSQEELPLLVVFLTVAAPLVALQVLARHAPVPVPVSVRSPPAPVAFAALAAPFAAAPFIGGQLAFFMPEGASTFYEAVRSLFLVGLAVAVLLFLPVVFLAIYYPWRYRDAGDQAPPRGRAFTPRVRRALIAFYTIVPGVLILSLGVVSVQILAEVEDVPEGTLHVEVTGERWNWTFEYPDGTSSTNLLRVPVDEVVVLHVQSVDVVHSFFVPQLGVKIDALPHYENTFWFRAIRAGQYEAHCAEFCGWGHTVMEAVVIVEPARR